MHYGRWRLNGDPLVFHNLRGFPFAERFWMRVAKTEGCWEWTAHRNSQGYGMVGTSKATSARAHRVAWQLTHGPIPAGLFVCHHCDNPPCVRPDHLFLGTRQDNTDDRERKGRSRIAPAVQASVAARRRQTHCKHGHPLSGDNLYEWNGHRACRICREAARAKSRTRS